MTTRDLLICRVVSDRHVDRVNTLGNVAVDQVEDLVVMKCLEEDLLCDRRFWHGLFGLGSGAVAP